tara:strand:+ start:241 stop:459 length:219 start_codon:yes stop_codon:yes gene_type:complete
MWNSYHRDNCALICADDLLITQGLNIFVGTHKQRLIVLKPQAYVVIVYAYQFFLLGQVRITDFIYSYFVNWF